MCGVVPKSVTIATITPTTDATHEPRNRRRPPSFLIALSPEFQSKTDTINQDDVSERICKLSNLVDSKESYEVTFNIEISLHLKFHISCSNSDKRFILF